VTSPAATTPASITVVGLGPGGHDHVTMETRNAIASIDRRFLRTARHPSADLVPDATTFDDVYDGADRFDDVYTTIVERLVAAATDTTATGPAGILYAVPGSPLVLERTVRLLRERARALGLAVDVLPALSFLDVAWARLGIDPIESGVRLVDGHEFATAAAGDTGPLLVAHTHANWVLSDIKLAVDGDPDVEVVILQRLGTADEAITATTWADLDRAVPADHLTSVFVPSLATPVAAGYVRFHQLTRTLRERCPWDVEQTHASLVPYLVEETFEVVDAIDALDPDDPHSDEALIEELGDLLYQVEFHATIAEQDGRFTIDDVTRGIHDKLVRRHPHVFGDTSVAGTGEVLENWDAIKAAEKAERAREREDTRSVDAPPSALDGVSRSLPALSFAQQIGRKAAKVGFDWPDVEGALGKVGEEAAEIVAATEDDARADEVGDLLFAVVNVARHLGVDAEVALRSATNRFQRRFRAVEREAAERGIDLRAADLATLDQLWDAAKAVTRRPS
jgi:tetrapyrrole methylase family protein/MazG family protein